MKIDSPHILCINPWIHDFAAYDFWARPLGLLTLAGILLERGVRVSFIDCLDRYHPKEKQPVKVQWDGRGPFRKTQIDLPDGLEKIHRKFSRYGIKKEWFDQDLKKIQKPDLILVTSLMTYWASGVTETIENIKRVYPEVPLVLGGIYASLCFEQAKKNTLADEVMKGPGEFHLRYILGEYTGFDLGDMGKYQDLDQVPFPALYLQNSMAYAPIQTSRGCPFSCDYCAASFLEPKLRRRSSGHVFEEIQYWYRKNNIRNFAFYDDALLLHAEKYAFPLFEKVIASDMIPWFHTPNALHINAITKKAAVLMHRAGFKTIRLGLETTVHRRHDLKVATDAFFVAVENLKSAGFEAHQLGAYLLCGLPEQNLDDVEASVRLVKKTGIIPVLAFYTPIPHTPLWEKAVRTSKYDLLKHPVFTNNTLFPCVHSNADVKRISQLKRL